MPVDPTPDDIKRFFAEDTGGPVVMLNLLRFAEGGRATYADYALKTQPFLESVGGRVIYAGDCSTALVSPEGFNWDTMLAVFYPSRQAFLEMVTNPEYQKITHIRTEALAEAVLQATSPWDGAMPEAPG